LESNKTNEILEKVEPKKHPREKAPNQPADNSLKDSNLCGYFTSSGTNMSPEEKKQGSAITSSGQEVHSGN
jgi:hypothetical protein